MTTLRQTGEQHRRYLEEARRLAKGDPGRFRFREPDPIEAILFRMDEQGLRQADIAAIVGGKNRASEILCLHACAPGIRRTRWEIRGLSPGRAGEMKFGKRTARGAANG